jgi:electron transfer flavoprotein beta subunit
VKIIVLVKEVPDTWDERRIDISTGLVDRAASNPVIDEVNERALEVALSYRDGDKSSTVTLLSVAPSSAAASLRKALAIGADDAIHVADDALRGADAAMTARVIAAALRSREWDLVLAGNESTDGRGGVVPGMVGELLGVPALTFLDSVELTQTTVRGTRTTDDAKLTVSASLPALVSVTERTPEARMAGLKGTLGARKKPIETVSLDRLDPGPAAAHSVVRSTAERPLRSAGQKIIDDGTAAAALADFLASNGLG